jgi:hypothetical protein
VRDTLRLARPAFAGADPAGLTPGHPSPSLDLRPDLDAIGALSTEREALWTRFDKAIFLIPNEKRSAVGYGPLEGGDDVKGSDPADRAPFDPKANFNPGQLRIPSGQPGGGQWTGEGGGLLHLTQDRRGFRIDLTEHEGPNR